MHKNIVGGILLALFAILGTMLFIAWDTTAEMAWSYSKNKCVRVTYKGEVLENGCKLVSGGTLKAETYYVK